MSEDSCMLSILDETTPSLSKSLSCVCRLSVPVILAQITSIAMRYIDAAMVGRLGAESSAAIGLAAPATWLIHGICAAASSGFSVQAAHAVGAKNRARAQSVVKQSIIVIFLFSLAIGFFCAAKSAAVPRWLGAPQKISRGAAAYFFVSSSSLPVAALCYLSIALMECAGLMKLACFLSALMCALDVLFNALCIYALKLGEAGAALGTALAQASVALFSLIYICAFSPLLNVKKSGPWKLTKDCLKTAAKIGLPMAFEQAALSSAYVAGAKIVAPLGTVALAANSFAVTAEAICYMPGYGVSSAATTLVGQSVGAGRPGLAKRFSFLCAAFGICVMTATALAMFFAAPSVFKFLTPDMAVQELGTKVLRIELFAEPFFAAAIVISGALRGAGDTFIPGIMNLACMWGMRIPLSLLLSARFGLLGAWIAMAAELSVRGMIFIARLAGKKF